METEKTKVTCEDYAVDYIRDEIYDLMREMYWVDKFDSEAIKKYMIETAIIDNVELTDIEEFDYDQFFYQEYADKKNEFAED